MRFIIWVMSIFFFWGCAQNATKSNYEVFVSPQGNDDYPGTQSQPVASLEQAARIARQWPAGQTGTIWLAEGRYVLDRTLELGMEDGGDSEHSMRWSAVPGTYPVISGGLQVNDWRDEGDGFWSAPIPEKANTEFRALYINNHRAVRARYPDTTYLHIREAGQDLRTNFYFNEGDIPALEHPEEVELVFLHDWSISRIQVAKMDWDRQHLLARDSIGARSLDFFTLTGWEPHPRYFLENAREFLDQPGEWYGDQTQKRIYYKPHPGDRMETLKAYIPQAVQLLHIAGTETQKATGIEFIGITFEHTNWALPTRGYAGIQACMYDDRRAAPGGWDQVPAAIEMVNACRIQFQQCTLQHAGGSGLWIGQNCDHCTVQDSYFTDISGNAINIGEGQDRKVDSLPWWQIQPEDVSHDNLVQRCVIEQAGAEFFGAVGIWGGLVAQTTIEGNEVRNLPYTGISIGWMWDTITTPCRENQVIDNHIHHIMNTLSDGGGVYSLGRQPGSRITGNVIHDVSINAGRAESNGMFLDEGTKELEVSGNIIYQIAMSPLRFHRAASALVKDNYLLCSPGVPPIRYNRTPEENITKIDNVIGQDTSSKDLQRVDQLVRERLQDRNGR